MNRLIPLSLVFGSLVASVAIACGGDDAAVEPPGTGSDATVQDGAASGDSSTPTQDGATNSDGSTSDAPKGDGTTPGNGTSNPGQITCGSTACTGGMVCCLRFQLDGGRSETCENNCSGPGSFDIRCDEKADCPNGGDRCCLGFGGTSCENNCPGPANQEVVLCKTQAECGDAGCSEKTCANRKVFVCGNPGACK